jgi:hypothetical protein
MIVMKKKAKKEKKKKEKRDTGSASESVELKWPATGSSDGVETIERKKGTKGVEGLREREGRGVGNRGQTRASWEDCGCEATAKSRTWLVHFARPDSELERERERRRSGSRLNKSDTTCSSR